MKRIASLALLLVGLVCKCPAQSGISWDGELRAKLNQMAESLTSNLKPWVVPDKVFRVDDFGAIADGQTVNTKAINQAIATCAAKGGGVVLFSKGDYVSGTIVLESGVMLEVSAGARILGSTNLADYPDRVAKRRTVMDSIEGIKQSLIYAEGCERIGIRGGGEINGRGTQANFPGKKSKGPMPGRPFGLRIIDCKKIVLDGITLKDAACWMQDYLNCEDLILQGITVDNQANVNNDGTDIDGCHNVIVRDCTVNSQDDGLCFKGASLRPMENVLVENCKFYTPCFGIKFGTDSQGDFRNVLIRNVEVGGLDANQRLHGRAQSGIAWMVMDGGTLENVLVTNAHIVRAELPFMLRLGNRGRVLPEMAKPKPGILRRVVFENITGEANCSRGGSIFSGIPTARIEDVLLRNVKIFVAGGGKETPSGESIPEKESDYPDMHTFGPHIPAYGFWVRHAANVRFIDVSVTPKKPDARPCFSLGGDTENVTVDGKSL